MRHQLYTWGFTLSVVVFSSIGDVLLAKGMSKIGDFGKMHEKHGTLALVRAVFTSGWFMAGVGAMAFAFFSMLIALSWADLSFVAPASASLTFVASAVMAKFWLHERVDTRRWVAVMLVCFGVMFLAK
jgi:drug/metabolite transporter (DMT)-like permease